MQFIGGASQREYVDKTRGLDPSRCLAAGIDVGKYEALCLIADHRGEVLGEALTFPLTEPGVRALERQLSSASTVRSAVSIRIGVETAGHYHRTVVARLVAGGHDVVELNPAHVKATRAQQGSRRLKTDLRDAAAIVDLVISGSGRPPQQRADALVEQLVWAGVRRRRVHARTALTNQLLGTLDLVFPGLDGCFDDLLATKVGPILLHELADPDRLHRLGVEGLRAFTARRGVRLQRAKAAQLHQAAADALRLPTTERACRATALAADLAVLDVLNRQIELAEHHLATVLSDTPAGVLTSLPGVGSSGPRTTAPRWATRPGSATPTRPTAPPGSSQPRMSPPAEPAAGRASAAKATPSCAPRSSNSVAAWPNAILTSPATRPASAAG